MTAALFVAAFLSVACGVLAVYATPALPESKPRPVIRHRRRPVLIAAGRVALVAALVWSVSIRPDWNVA